MKFLELRNKIKDNLFTFEDVVKYFALEKEATIRQQLSRFVGSKLIFSIKKGLYCFDPKKVNPLFLANLLYQPSYVSGLTALFFYGMVPDIPQIIVSVTTITKKTFHLLLGDFVYFKIKPELYFGFEVIKIKENYVRIATKEKALLDFVYLNKIKEMKDLRIDWKKINLNLFKKYLKSYPVWVRKIIWPI